MNCVKCGKENPDTSMFCMGCGETLPKEGEVRVFNPGDLTGNQPENLSKGYDSPYRSESGEPSWQPSDQRPEEPVRQNAHQMYQPYNGPIEELPPRYDMAPRYTPTYSRYSSGGTGYAITSMVLGIISIFFAGLILGLLAINYHSKAKKSGYEGGMSTAGLVTGIIGIVGWAFMIFFYINQGLAM